MSIKTGTAVGEFISPHIKDTEWKCRASNYIKYDTVELEMLEKLRSDFGAEAIIIESGYRTTAYNQSIGGASGSPHTKGYAADVRFIKDGKLIPTEVVCCHAQDMGFKGIAICRGSGTNAHLDMYNRIYRGDERKGNYGNNIAGNDWYKETGLSKIDVQKYLMEDEEMVYKDVADVPVWGRVAVQRRIEAGATKGEDLTESMVRTWVIDDRMNPYYEDLIDVPNYWLTDVEEMVNAGFIFGDGKHDVAMTHSELKPIIVAYRMTKANKAV